MTLVQNPNARTLERIETPQEAAVARLAEWANAADAAHKIAETLVQTSFCPDSFKGKAGEATAAILAGLEVGLQPMASLTVLRHHPGAGRTPGRHPPGDRPGRRPRGRARRVHRHPLQDARQAVVARPGGRRSRGPLTAPATSA
jgi:hypothetical protein